VFLTGCNLFSPTADKTDQTDQTDQAQTAQEQTDISIKDFTHSPNTLTVKAGEEVSVINLDIAGHSVTSDDGTSIDTGVLSQNKTATFTAPSEPGEYAYHCTPHPNMQAVLIVE